MTPRALPLRLLRLPRLWSGWLHHGGRLCDPAAAVLVTAAAVTRARPLLDAADLATGSGDWHAHAYRIRDLAQHGLAPWTHDWAGGLPLWGAYQFVPHLLTWLAVLVTGAGETRAMAVAQGTLLVWLPLSVFLVLRLSGLRTGSALVGALLAVALDTRRQPVANFSELWGLALAPPLLWAAYRTGGRRSGYAVAIAAGASIYVHPLAAVTGGIGMVAAAVAPHRPTPPSPERDAREQAPPAANVAGSVPPSLAGKGVRGLGTQPVALLLQTLLALGAAGFFLWPAIHSARPAYEHPYFASVQFERMLARLATGSFLPGWPVWLTIAAAAAAALALRGGGERRQGARFLLVTAALVGVLAGGSTAGLGPSAYQKMQLPRLLSLAPLLAAAALALATDEMLSRSRNRWRPVPALVAGAAVALAVVSARPVPLSEGSAGGEPFRDWLLSRPAPIAVGARIAAGPEIVAEASALAYGRAWYTGSYSGREWSVLGGPLAMFMDGFGAADTRAAYLTAMAVELAVVPSGARPLLVDPRTGASVAWQEVARLGELDILRLPWRAPYAVSVPRGADAGLEVPNVPFTTVDDSYVRDELTRRYAALVTSADAVPARVRVPSGTVIDIELRELPPDRVLLVSENWDTAWRAEAGGVRLPVRRAGPNLLAVDLAGAPGGVRGDVYLRLTHGLPRAWWLGGLVMLLTLPAAALALRWGPQPAVTEARRRRDQ